MKYIHVKKLDKYHPGYKDRNLIWCKVYFKMVNADPDFEMMPEIDKWRFIAFIILELQTQKPIPIINEYLKRKGFNLKKRPISKTLQMLHNFIEVRNDSVTQRREEKSREEEEVEKRRKDIYGDDAVLNRQTKEVFNYFADASGHNISLTSTRRGIIRSCFKRGGTVRGMKKAIDNFFSDGWDGRSQYWDIVYCLGVRSKVDNYDKWREYKPRKDGIDGKGESTKFAGLEEEVVGDL